MRLRIFTICSLLIGLVLLTYSLTIPYYKDQKKADEFFENALTIEKSDYYKREAELRTNKAILMDLGSGITIASATFILFLISKNIRILRDFKKIRTLSKAQIFIWANLVWLLLLPGTYWYYMFRGGRGDYPPFADSIAIPLMTQIPVYLFLLIPLNIFILLTTYRSVLPTQLFFRLKHYIRPSILWEVFFGFWLLLNLILFVDFVVDGDHFSIPINLFFTYILLTLRAGKLAYFDNHIEDKK